MYEDRGKDKRLVEFCRYFRGHPEGIGWSDYIAKNKELAGELVQMLD